MTLDQFISNPPTGVNGTYVQFENDVADKGQCLPLVQVFMQQVQGIADPPLTSSAKNYWLDFETLGLNQWYTPIVGIYQPGDIMVYNAHSVVENGVTINYPDGHIAIYVSGEVFEQNADLDGSPAHLFNRATTYLLGALRYNNSNMNPTPAQAGATYSAFATNPDMSPGEISQADLNTAIQTPWAEWIPNFYPGVQTLRNDIIELTNERDNTLYPFVNAVTAALGLPTSATAAECVAAIAQLQNSTTTGYTLVTEQLYTKNT